MSEVTAPAPAAAPKFRRVVVTGVAGFIGSHLATTLLRNGTTVIGVDRRDPAKDPGAAANLSALSGLRGYMHIQPTCWAARSTLSSSKSMPSSTSPESPASGRPRVRSSASTCSPTSSSPSGSWTLPPA